MRKIKPFLFASALFATFGMSGQVLAEDQNDILLKKSDFNELTKTFDVIGEAQGKKIKQMDVAIWSEESGQDDLKWYSSSDFTSGRSKITFNLVNHKSAAGNYNIHVYTTYADGNKIGKVLENSVIKVNPPIITRDNTQVRLENTILPPSDSELVTAVWSEENGQDDLKWYSTSLKDNIISLANHKGRGNYNFHTYLKKNGEMSLISAQTLQINQKVINYTLERSSDTSYDLIINDVPKQYASLSIPVWSDVNGQDDIKWYPAIKQSETSYKVKIPLTNHGFDYGHFSTHIYATNTSTMEQELLLATDGFDVKEIKSLVPPKIMVSPMNNGQFTVSVAEVEMSKKVTGLRTTVTSLSDASLSQTLFSKAIGYGKASNSFDLKSINVKAGVYSVIAMVEYSDGSSETFNLANQEYKPQLTYLLSNTSASPKITTYINEQNTYPVGQCTWGVKTLAPWVPNWLGNANGWATNMKNKGFRVGNVPEVGAVAVWPYDGGGYGHVAYVTAVESMTRIQVKESNYAGKQYISNFRGWFNPLSAVSGGSVLYVYPN